MEYYFNQLDPVKFQRLINAILVARFGEDARLTPLRGQDGGRDGETAPGNPYFEFQVSETTSMSQDISQPPRKGRYLFQVKHHRTTDKRLSDVRQTVTADFAKELKNNVLNREGDERVNYFFLITNVPSSKKALNKLDRTRDNLLRSVPNLHADVWWQERVITHLDQMPSIWNSFPDMFAGGLVPLLARVVDRTSEGLPRAIRLAINRHYEQDRNVKFRQIELEQSLSKLFVDLDVDIRDLSEETRHRLVTAEFRCHEQIGDEESRIARVRRRRRQYLLHSARSRALVSALGILLDDNKNTSMRKLVLEGGPGQGKSTITQMAVQIYRQQILGRNDIVPERRWILPEKLRLPFRVELRRLAEWLTSNPDDSIEQYLALMIKQDSGGSEVSVEDIHTAVEKSPVFLVFDGLDEIGSDTLRGDVLKKITECIHTFETGLQTDLRVVVTTRPPALAGRRESLIEFERLTLAPMEEHRINEYVTRWLSVQIREGEERERIRESFERRQNEPHVKALARNPMQLSVLLQFIELKGEAFPDRRAELYRDYFQIVIDRDVEKSPELRENRDIVEALHAFLGYRIHALTEVNQADRTLVRKRLLDMVEKWLESQAHEPKMAQQFFRLGEERFGLIVASRGEGEETRYGYEVQPIQEYFAAAFISNQTPASSAHQVFEAMIHRPYWREVALFLAGLRRPNEKADLVARARKIDQDTELGWYQGGRAIVLQLLQEGVLSDPRYVFSQALDFVLDLIDARRVRVQREPTDLLTALETLVSRDPLEQHQERVLQLLREYRTCDDWYIVLRLYGVASRLLQPDDVVEAVMSYGGSRPDLVAQVRLGWPYSWELDVEKLTRSPSFWQGVPDHIWAEVWWRETLLQGVALDLSAPAGIHQRLVEQFAIDPGTGLQFSHRKQPFIETQSNLAIWRLVRCQQMIQLLGMYRNLSEISRELVQKEIMTVRGDDLEVDYTGLEEPVRTTVRDLIRLSHSLLTTSCSNEGQASPVDYIQGVRTHLRHPGLASWVACQGLANIAQSIVSGASARHPGSGILHLTISKEDLLSLVRDIRPFYESLSSNESDVLDESDALDFLLDRFGHRHMIRRYQTGAAPKYVRLESGIQPVALVDLLTQSVRSGSEMPYGWLKTMQLSTEVIRPLVERCRDCLPDLLASLGKRRSVSIGSGAPLRVQDTQRILKIARNTEDSAILAGVATALLGASFLRIAKPSLILKILHAAPNTPLGPMLFAVYKIQPEDRDPDSFSKEIKTIGDVASGILDNPDYYAFQTVCQAAGFLAEHTQVSFPPLLHEEENLGISLPPLASGWS